MREQVAEAVLPVVVAVREQVQAVVPEAPPAPPAAVEAALDPAIALATRLIMRWEVTSPAYYTRRLQGVYCPGGISGPTWGLGWDGGHQTERDNRRAWSVHPDVERLAKTSGQSGKRCRASADSLADVRTPLSMAELVFAGYALPKYQAMAERKYGPGIATIPAGARAALWSETYNRGGIRDCDGRSREQCVIRDKCIPAGDGQCVAKQLRAMCRLWVGTVHDPGLCNRRNDEASTAQIPDGREQ